MTTWLIAGITCLSLYWTFASAMYVEASATGAAIAVVLGVAMLTRAASLCPAKVPSPALRTNALIFAALLIAALGLPMPYKIGPILTLAGLLGFLTIGGGGESTSAPHQRTGTGVSHPPFVLFHALAFAGFVLIVQSALLPVYLRIFSRGHDLPFLRRPLYALLRLFGCDATLGETSVFVPTMRYLHNFPVTSERLALFSIAAILIGFFAALIGSPMLRRATRRAIPAALVVAAVYAIVRYAVVTVLYLYLMHRMGYEEAANRVDVFWDPWWTAITLFPLAFGLAAVAPWCDRLDWFEDAFGRVPGDPRHRRPAVCLSILALAAILAWATLPEPGARKAGRILVDEYHSNWEKTTRPFDTTWYGSDAGYNYYSIHDYLSRHYSIARQEEPITTSALSRCDVLIVKIPTRAYTDDEVATIADFVRQGGGLFLIGEHTNVFGSGVYLNKITERFGFQFRFDCLFDTRRKFEQAWRPSRLLPHAVVQHVPLFFFQVSCSIEPLSLRGEPVIIGTRLKSLGVDYHSQNFYPQPIDRSDMDFGPYIEMWARGFGKGRVLAFGDSTCFSNFCAFQPGKPELLLSSIEWLNYRSLRGCWKFCWLALALFAAIAAIVLTIRSFCGTRTITLIVFFCAGAVPLLAWGARWLNQGTRSLPLPQTALLTVSFEREHCDYELPIEGFVTQPTRSYDLFYQWVLRLGHFPSVGMSLTESLAKGDAVVLLNPVREFSPEEIERLKNYVNAGGGLVILDGANPSPVATEPLLRAFGIRVARETPPYSGLVWGSAGTTFTVESARPLVGGTPLARGMNGEVLAASFPMGKGHVVVALFASRFNDQSMGGMWGVQPSAELMAVYQTEFAMIQSALAGWTKWTGWTNGTNRTDGTDRTDSKTSASTISTPP